MIYFSNYLTIFNDKNKRKEKEAYLNFITRRQVIPINFYITLITHNFYNKEKKGGMHNKFLSLHASVTKLII